MAEQSNATDFIQSSNKAREYEKNKNKSKKYNYTYEEYSQDTRSYTVESDVKLTEEEIQDIALGCTLTDGYTYEGGKQDKRFKATFKGTEFGDDTQTEYGGDEIKKEDTDAGNE